MPQFARGIPGVAAVVIQLEGWLNSLLLTNTEAGAGLTVNVYFDDALSAPYTVQPGDSLIIRAEDTSKDSLGKIKTKRITVTGTAVGAAAIQGIYTVKAGDWEAIKGDDHPVQV
jgi:hypothetical protein